MTSPALSEDVLRVAFFPDSYHEINGVANTSRQFEAFARRRGLPFLVVHGVDLGGVCASTEDRRALPRGKLSFAIEKRHDFDVLFLRHLRLVEEWLEDFNPDIVHVTGPSDVGLLGTLAAHRLKIPLAASWHTNLHQYAQQRSVSHSPDSRTGLLSRWATLSADLLSRSPCASTTSRKSSLRPIRS